MHLHAYSFIYLTLHRARCILSVSLSRSLSLSLSLSLPPSVSLVLTLSLSQSLSLYRCIYLCTRDNKSSTIQRHNQSRTIQANHSSACQSVPVSHNASSQAKSLLHGVALVSRIDKITRLLKSPIKETLFCKRDL